MMVRSRSFLVLALGFCTCSLDDRPLLLAPDDAGMAGAFAVGGSGAGGGSAGEATAGSGASNGGLVDGCADLDTDGIADCETTLADNPSFTEDVSGWTPLGDATLTWDPHNALDDLPSGSAKLSADTSGAASPLAKAFQCVPLSGAQLVIAYASAFVEPAGDDDDPVRAALEVSFFEGEDCSGASDGYFETPPSAVMGEWTTIHAGGLTKETTSSASIALIGIRAASASDLNVYFDNVMLKAMEP